MRKRETPRLASRREDGFCKRRTDFPCVLTAPSTDGQEAGIEAFKQARKLRCFSLLLTLGEQSLEDDMECKSITRLFAFLLLLFFISTSGYALGQTPREPDPQYMELLESAVSRMKAGDKDQALAVLDKAIALDQKVVLAYIVKAKIIASNERL